MRYGMISLVIYYDRSIVFFFGKTFGNTIESILFSTLSALDRLASAFALGSVFLQNSPVALGEYSSGYAHV